MMMIRQNRVIAGACGLPLVLGATAVGQVDLRPPAPPPVVDAAELTPWIVGAEVGRADVVCLGDSNQLHLNNGWDQGWTRALAQRFGLYATGLLTPGENTGNSAGSGYQYAVASTLSSGQFQYNGAPIDLNVYLNSGAGLFPLDYLFVPAGVVAGQNGNQGVVIERGSAIDISGPLRFEVTYGLFPIVGGEMQLSVRETESPFATLWVGPAVSTFGVGPGATSTSIVLPAANRPRGLNFRMSPWAGAIAGPFVGYYMRVENQAAASGASLHTLFGTGGASARDMAQALLNADDRQLTLYFSKVREWQGAGPRRVLVRVNSALNDRVEPLASVTTGLTPGSSPAAFAENLQAIIDRLRGIWTLNGWPADELFFLLAASHPVSEPDQPLLVQYRQAAAQVARANERTAAIDFGVLTSWGELVTNNWYRFGGFDTNHLEPEGYDALAARELAAIEAGACYRDLNNDGVIDVRDLIEWHAARPDVNLDGASDALDRRCLQETLRAGEAADGRGAE